MVTPYRGVATGCTHAPLTNPKHWARLIEETNRVNPDYFIHLGDAFEGQLASKWVKDPRHDWDIFTEFDAFEKQIKEINLAAPNAKKIFIYGNHDSNLLHSHDRLTETEKKFVNREWEEIKLGLMSDWYFPCDRYMHRAHWRLGQLTFQHGCNLGKSSSQTHLYKEQLQYGVPYGLHVSAHTHTAVQVSQHQWLDQWGRDFIANVGTLINWDK